MGGGVSYCYVPAEISDKSPFYPRNNWRCDYCKSKTPSHYDKCPNCGAPKPDQQNGENHEQRQIQPDR